MRRFGTQGPVHPQRNYVVSRAADLAEFIRRVKEGRYIVIFAPRQTGKTTFFQRALDVFADEEPTYHNQQKYIVETKIWEGKSRYQAGKKPLAAYLKLEGVTEGSYVVFDHRYDPEPRVETETIDDVTVRSYVIPVLQERPSNERLRDA